MKNDFANMNLDDINLEEFNAIKMGFSKEEKDNIKKNLRKKITKRKNGRNGLVAAAAILMISAVLAYNGSSVLAKVLPTLNKFYSGLGFKSEYLLKSAYIGKTYEENDIKVTLENLVVTKHVIKVSLKTEYGAKWRGLKKPLVFFGYSINGERINTGSFGGSRNIDENTEVKVVNFNDTDREFPSKLNLKIEASSDAFKKSLVWNINEDFSKNFNRSIEKEVTMSKDIGVNINHIESNEFGTIICANKWLDSCYLKIDNKIYPLLGGGSGNEKEQKYYTFLENISYDTMKKSKRISFIKHTKKKHKADIYENMTKEESIEYGNKTEAQLDKLTKAEMQGIIYTKEIRFTNGNKAEIYKIDRKGGKIHIYIKGDDRKQVFNMIPNLYTSLGGGVQCIEENSIGYIVEFDDPLDNAVNNKLIIKMTIDILDCFGDYNEEEIKITLK